MYPRHSEIVNIYQWSYKDLAKVIDGSIPSIIGKVHNSEGCNLGKTSGPPPFFPESTKF